MEVAGTSGHKLWYIPDGYIPVNSAPGAYESHESICVLNTSSEAAELRITIFYEEQDPWGNITVTVPGRRTKHIRTSSLSYEGTPIPIGVPYAMEVVSSIPVLVQYSRLDATQAENALMSIMAYPMK
ncbi:sensory rhodopsin transducer [Paenibacillus sp. GCM10023252]|uniref:sensory rhodopsin transducer n=1 Tax=Paenibacillus sp. GCM10023252 TaxID=3252649 RepID=UPI003616BBBE